MLVAASHHSPRPFLPLGRTLRPTNTEPPPRTLSVSAAAQPRRQLQVSKQQKREIQGELKGMDVLRAMQRAAAERKKGKSKRKGGVAKSSVKEEEEEEEEEDYSNLRDLVVKREWGERLDELEKLVEELM